MSWVRSNMTDDTRRNINTFFGSRSDSHDPSPMRGLLGIAMLILSGILLYTSLPYAGSFVNIGKVVGVSKLDRQIEVLRSGLVNTAPVKKVYLRAGQSLVVQYDLPKAAELELKVMRCKSRPIIEVWSCKDPVTQIIEVRNEPNGVRQITAPEPGFYYFTDTVTLSGAPQSDYQLIWKRT